jgi:hypothetical protein
MELVFVARWVRGLVKLGLFVLDGIGVLEEELELKLEQLGQRGSQVGIE